MIVGIDLGTTNSLISVWEDSGPRLIPNSLGDVLTPSCVSLDKDGSVLVGKAARERLQSHPDRTAAVFKRYMGSEKLIRLGKKEFRAEELSALILRSLKEDAEAVLSRAVTEAIITVPAYFSDAQRKATRAAGQLAGLQVNRLLNEPTAAALAYGIHLRGKESKFLVFDLGGGTFDISVLDLFEDVMEVKASAGDNFLGGEDFVLCLVEQFFAQNDLPPKLKSDARFIQVLSAKVEAAKRQLSESPETTIRITHADTEYTMHLTEADMERYCASLLARLRDPVERALRDADLRSSELDNIVLAGGATRMPAVRKMVARMFGRFPAMEINPDEVVALGAAVQAGLQMKDAALKEVVMTDVAPYSLGVDIAIALNDGTRSVGHFDPIIERNSAIPISRSKRYFPNNPQQRTIDLGIFQGEARMVKDNIRLGKLIVPLPNLPYEDSDITVRFTYDINGILQVEATVMATQEVSSITIEDNPGVLSKEDIAKRFIELAELKVHPRDRMEYRTLLARGERLYEQLRSHQREQLGANLRTFEHCLDTQDIKMIEQHRPHFERMLDEIEHQNFLNPQ